MQQEEPKRPKSPEREDVQLVEQHGSGGEGGEDEERDRVVKWRRDSGLRLMTGEQLDEYMAYHQQLSKYMTEEQVDEHCASALW